MSPNRLAEEHSPYLRMHADDHVDWHTWGEEAFREARERNVPLFLSSGYAACHWCHVMQRDSFRDPVTADFLNRNFVPVKVDRETRPDVDGLFMDYVVASAGSGGWPMTVVTTPDLVPVFGGTYFPREHTGPLPTLMDVLMSVHESWQEGGERVREASEASLGFLREQNKPRRPGPVSRAFLDDAAETIVVRADREKGGFGGAPKFPQAPVVLFLLAYHEATGEFETGDQAMRALRGMVRGGIYDQAGGGLCRYSVDDSWLVPHFEKMLYDNALLLQTIAAAVRIAPDDELAHAARATAAFLDRDLAAPGGGYAASRSADTNGAEGSTYTWWYGELVKVLTPEELTLAEARLGVTEAGNWQGVNILTRREGREEEAEAVDALLGKLLELRMERPQPDLDEKVVVSWNALTARGLMEAGAAIGDAEMSTRGLATLELMLDRAVDGVEVVHVLDDPSTAGIRLLEDYAGLAAACLTAVDLGLAPGLLDRARSLHAAAAERFTEDGAAFMTPIAVDLPVRPLEQHDNPTPTGASLFAENALRLAKHGDRDEHLSEAAAALGQWWMLLDVAPLAGGQALVDTIMLLQEEGEM